MLDIGKTNRTACKHCTLNGTFFFLTEQRVSTSETIHMPDLKK